MIALRQRIKWAAIIWLTSMVVVGILPLFETHTVIGGGGWTVLYGLPFPFLEQHPTWTPMEPYRPLDLTFMDPREHPTQILWGSWLLNVGIVSAVIASTIAVGSSCPRGNDKSH